MRHGARVSVLLRAGGMLSLFFLSLLSAGDPGSVPHIQLMAPTEGQAGDAFTLLGRNFSPTPAGNTVQFGLPNGSLTATVTSASETVLTGIVPNGVERSTSPLASMHIYRVTVTTDQGASNGAGFTPEADAASLELLPRDSFLLLPPGKGSVALVFGGGTPPYTLLPLEAGAESVATVELVGTVVRVAGVGHGEARITIQDSGAPARKKRSSVFVQEPTFGPPFDVSFRTLLAGTAPGFTVESEHRWGDMSIKQVEIRMENVEIGLGALYPGYTFGLSELDAGFLANQYFEVTDHNETQAEFVVVSYLLPGRQEKTAATPT